MLIRTCTLALTVLVTVAALPGCSSDTGMRVGYQSLVDPGRTLAAPAESTVQVRMGQWTVGDGRPRIVVIEHEDLTLPQRNMLADVRDGAAGAGFRVVDADADFMLIAYDRLYEGERDTYQRVPVFESHSGTIHTSRGFRTYHGSATRSVIVPQRKPYVHRQLNMMVYPADAPIDPTALDPEGSHAVWMGSLVGDVSVVDPMLSDHIRRLLEQWGRTEERTLRYPQPR